MNCTFGKAEKKNIGRINELFIEMLQTVYHTDKVSGYSDAEAYAKEIKIHSVYLHVEKSNLAALRLYKRLGYQIQEDQGQRYLLLKTL